MSKKHKRNLQVLLKKRQQLQYLNQSSTEPLVALPQPIANLNLPKTVTVPALPEKSRSTNREVTKTLLSFAAILVLLAVAVIIDRKTPFLTEFGNWLYSALRLNN